MGTVSPVLALERRAGARGALRGLAGAPPGMPQGSRRLYLCELLATDDTVVFFSSLSAFFCASCCKPATGKTLFHLLGFCL